MPTLPIEQVITALTEGLNESLEALRQRWIERGNIEITDITFRLTTGSPNSNASPGTLESQTLQAHEVRTLRWRLSLAPTAVELKPVPSPLITT